MPADNNHAATATAMFPAPAVISAPDNPMDGMRRKAEARTPITAPRLFRK